MTKAREIAELGQKLTVDGSGNLDIAGTVETDGALKVGSGSTLFGAADSGLNHFSNNYMYLAGGSNGTIIKSKGLATEYAKFEGSAISFNEDSNDMNFRVESNNNANALLVDAGADRVNFFTTAGYSSVNIEGNLVTGGTGNRGVFFGDGMNSTNKEWFIANDSANSNQLNLYEYEDGTYVTNRMVFKSGGNTEFNNSTGTEFVINQAGADVDFRVESDGNENMLFVNAGLNAVGINETTPNAKLHITTGTNSGTGLEIETGLDNGSFSNPVAMKVNQIGGTTSEGVYPWSASIGGAERAYQFVSRNGASTGAKVVHASVDSSNVMRTRMEFTNTETTFNEGSRDFDFRVESDGNSHMIFVDAGNNVVSINNAENQSAFVLNVVGTNVSGGRVAKLAGGDVNTSTSTSAPHLVIENNNTTTGNFSALAFASSNGGTTAFIGAKNTNHTTHSGDLYIATRGPTHGYLNKVFIGDTSMVINDSGVDYDFRVETNSDTHALFVRGDTNFVSVGAGTGGFAKLHVADVPSSEYRTFMVSDPNDISKGIVMAYDLTNDRGVMHALDAGTGWKNIALAAQGGSVSIGMPVTGTIDAPLHVEGGPVMTGGWIRSQMLEGNFPTLVFHSTYGTDSYGGIGYDSTNENLDFWVGATSHDISSGSQKVLRLRDTDGFIWNDNSKSHLDFRVESDNNSGMLVVDASQDAVTIGSHRFAQTPQSAYNEFVHFNTGSTLVNSNSSTTVNLFNRGGTNVACCGTVYVACENSGANVHWGYIIDFFHSNGTLFTNARATGNSQGTTTCSVQTNGSSISVTVTYSSGLGGNIRYNAGGHASVCNY